MDFCPRCGRYLKDTEFQCPECGNIVREIPVQDNVAHNVNRVYFGDDYENVQLRNIINWKYFTLAFVVGFAGLFAATYFWRFSMVFFFIPLFLPMGKGGIGLGLLTGMIGGSVTALLLKYFLTGAWIA